MGRFASWSGLFGITLLSQTLPQPGLRTPSLWVAFRFAQNEVISHVGQLTDPVRITMKDVKNPPDPLTRDSLCGYPLPLTPERLRTFVPNPETIPAIGTHLSLLTGGNARMSVNVDRYIETWNGDPEVDIAVIATIAPTDLSRFRNTSSNYFLISTSTQPSPPQSARPESQARATRTTLNRFGPLGDLIELRAEAGWDIVLYRMINGAMHPTSVSFGCAD
jgi:hypothetical protein